MKNLLKFVIGLISEADGTPSSSRFLMMVFSGFSMWVVSKLLYHATHITDAMTISVYLSNLPLILTALMGLIALPYSISKGASAITDVAHLMNAAKNHNVTEALNDIKSMVSAKVQPVETTIVTNQTTTK